MTAAAAISIRAKSPATIPMLIGGAWRAPTEMRFRPIHGDATHVGIVGALF
jgi:hypothetical protein